VGAAGVVGVAGVAGAVWAAMAGLLLPPLLQAASISRLMQAMDEASTFLMRSPLIIERAHPVSIWRQARGCLLDRMRFNLLIHAIPPRPPFAAYCPQCRLAMAAGASASVQTYARDNRHALNRCFKTVILCILDNGKAAFARKL
jgi:hypothetical protein